MSDLIKRKDAIKAIEELPNAYNGWSDAYDKAYIIGALEEIPSADRPQDDCSTCEHYNDVGDWCKTCGVSHYTPRMKGADDD